MEVDGAGEALGQPGRVEIEMGDLAKRVNAGIRPAGGEDAYSLARAGEDGVLDRALDGRSVALALPALERSAIIFEQQALAGHGAQPITVPTGSAKPRCSSSGVIGRLPARWTWVTAMRRRRRRR